MKGETSEEERTWYGLQGSSRDNLLAHSLGGLSAPTDSQPAAANIAAASELVVESAAVAGTAAARGSGLPHLEQGNTSVANCSAEGVVP